MSVVIVDGSTVRAFVENEAAFYPGVDSRFEALDLNGDGVLSRAELRRALETFRLVESHFGVDTVTPPEQLGRIYDGIFEQFDVDGSGTVDKEEFRAEMKRILLAIADGLGEAPIQMVLAEDDPSLIKEAADLEAAKIAEASSAAAAAE